MDSERLNALLDIMKSSNDDNKYGQITSFVKSNDKDVWNSLFSLMDNLTLEGKIRIRFSQRGMAVKFNASQISEDEASKLGVNVHDLYEIIQDTLGVYHQKVHHLKETVVLNETELEYFDIFKTTFTARIIEYERSRINSKYDELLIRPIIVRIGGQDMKTYQMKINTFEPSGKPKVYTLEMNEHEMKFFKQDFENEFKKAGFADTE